MFYKGMKRLEGAGRKKGTPNKRTEALFEKCERMGVDPFSALLEFVNHPDPMLRLAALKEICSYLYPKKKAIEVTEKLNPQAILHLEEFSQMSEQQLLEVIQSEMKEAKPVGEIAGSSSSIKDPKGKE